MSVTHSCVYFFPDSAAALLLSFLVLVAFADIFIFYFFSLVLVAGKVNVVLPLPVCLLMQPC